MKPHEVLEQIREAHDKAAQAVEDGHREGRVDLVEAGEAIAREIVEVIKLLDQIERAERQRWKTPSLRKADLMLRARVLGHVGPAALLF